MKAKRQAAKRLQIYGTNRFADIIDTQVRELAALFETKGHILADPQYYRYEKYYHPLVIVEMPTEQAAREMAERFGYTTQISRSRWTISRKKEVEALLKKIIPHLKSNSIKQKQAKIGLEMAEVLLTRPEGWKEMTVRLAEELKALKTAT
jgi:hypothetical protein